MVRRRLLPVFCVAMVLVLMVAAAFPLAVVAGEPVYHTVLWGQSLSWIASKYGVTVKDLVDANGLSNANVVYAGQRLLIPVPARQYTEHVVKSGESLLTIARLYDVSLMDIVRANGLTSIDYIYIGQRLRIPGKALPESPTAQEAIIISSPPDQGKVGNPVTITGWGSGYGNMLAVDALDEFGSIIGQGYVTVDAEPGKYGPFIGTIELDPAGASDVGRIQVYSISATDGAIEHLASVEVSAGEAGTLPTPETTQPKVQEAIVIDGPAPRIDVSSPITVTGWASSFDNTLGVDVLDEVGSVIGQGYVIIDAEFGEYGPFTGAIVFTPPVSAQIGRIQVYNISPSDGAIAHLHSVLVNLLP